MIYINKHKIVFDCNECLEAWTSYDYVIRLAMDFIKHFPVDLLNGLPWYLQYSCFWIDLLRSTIRPGNTVRTSISNGWEPFAKWITE
jgi:hypothetical protein